MKFGRYMLMFVDLKMGRVSWIMWVGPVQSHGLFKEEEARPLGQRNMTTEKEAADSEHKKDLTHYCRLWRWKKQSERQEMRTIQKLGRTLSRQLARTWGLSPPLTLFFLKSPTTCIFLNLKYFTWPCQHHLTKPVIPSPWKDSLPGLQDIPVFCLSALLAPSFQSPLLMQPL